PAPRVLAAVLAVAAGAGCAFACRRSARALRAAGRAAIGARSEREVRAAIRRTDSVAAGYGIVLGGRGGDCDAVVFTQWHGAAAIEVKTGHGTVTVDGDTMRVGRRVLHGNPARQAANGARWLARRLGGADVLAVVCVPGMTNPPFTASGVTVCGARDVGRVLKAAPRVFESADQAKAAMERLWRESAAAEAAAGARKPQVRAPADTRRPRRAPAGRSGRRQGR
ncbi:NERD domain-containing protein, partial [Actinomadura verrucosospora]|uniref:NERD domain-containing protein n=1 Tax=Actinomadura verrucosospora TaxID=46165 RepID=UPI0015656BFC